MRLLIIIGLFSFIYAQGLLNEIMIDPDDDNTGEFIEIYNNSDSILVVSTYYFCDAQDTDRVIPFPDSLLFPGQYGLILDPNYAGEYDDIIPDTVPRFSIEDSRFGMYGISNSTSKLFALLSPGRHVMDSYTTGKPFWPAPAYTMERHHPDDTLWQSSREPRGTPGFKNSTARKDRDMEISSLFVLPDISHLHIQMTVRNTGTRDLNTFSYGYIVGIDSNYPDLNDTLNFSSDRSLGPGDTLHCGTTLPLMAKGQHNITAFVSMKPDVCDTLTENCFIPLKKTDLLLTEFVCKTGDLFHSEYIEFLSRSSLPLQLSGLEIADLTGSTFIDTSYMLFKDSIIVFAQSSSFHDDFPFVNNVLYPPAWRLLNNGEDIIRLLNPSGSVISDLHYDADWDIPNNCAMQLVDTALDIRDPGNWEVSYSGSPGKVNSTEKQLFHLSCYTRSAFFTPLDTLAFSVINDGFFPLPEQHVSFVTARGIQNILVPQTFPGDTLFFYPDTTDRFLPGTQTCRIICEDHFNKGVAYYYPYRETPCYFNEILFDPVDTYGQAEFIELECIEDTVVLDSWTLEINANTVLLNDILQHGFYVLCKEGELPAAAPASRVLSPERFPVLPNAGALCSLYDPMGRLMDCCDLRDHPELVKGKSLEKQFEHQASQDAELWLSSVAPDAMTPGSRNSITALPGYRNTLSVYPQVFTPDVEKCVKFTVESETGIRFCELFCFNISGRKIFQMQRSAFSQPAVCFFWDGKMSGGDQPARGMYLVLAEIHETGGAVRQLRTILIVR